MIVPNRYYNAKYTKIESCWKEITQTKSKPEIDGGEKESIGLKLQIESTYGKTSEHEVVEERSSAIRDSGALLSVNINLRDEVAGNRFGFVA
ncbi:hypothetical protein Csa_016311 [Cucumis sativus]|uniref:Uncharacterized protein n=1 Tax=Cucumis sativus TaxID=3659 RepID=A0A0A0K712_CUCSA|nr:hypothetical protein Csa_016311 [Cucumis sativus]